MMRLHAVENLQEAIGRELNARHVGEEVELLVEGAERGRWSGRTRGNKIVFFPMDNPANDRTGQLVTVKVEEAGPWSMQGSLVRVLTRHSCLPAIPPRFQEQAIYNPANPCRSKVADSFNDPPTGGRAAPFCPAVIVV